MTQLESNSTLWVAKILNELGLPVQVRQFHTLKRAKIWLATVEMKAGQFWAIQAS